MKSPLHIFLKYYDGYWYLVIDAQTVDDVGTAHMRSPYYREDHRDDVVSYTSRIFPDAVIHFEKVDRQCTSEKVDRLQELRG